MAGEQVHQGRRFVVLRPQGGRSDSEAVNVDKPFPKLV